MKKILYSIMALAIAAMTFTACEDVPEPYPIPTPDGGGTEYTYEGNGTLESPYTCADAIHYAKSLGQAESENEVYVKGFITSITDEFSVQHGTASFVMSDTENGTNKFTFWRCPYLGNKKFVSGDTQIKVGDEVILKRTLQQDDVYHLMNGRFCGEAWDAVSRYVYTALQGGSIMKGWTNDDRIMIACCNDGTRPVIFKIERIDIPENDEEREWLAKQDFSNSADDAYTG